MLSLNPPADLAQRLGRYEVTATGGERVRAFVPPPLPPIPAIDLAPFQGLLERANQALGRLDGVASILPDTPLFLYMYVRKEAVLSSQIEGTQSSLSDLLLFEAEEAPGVPLDDVREVSNYVAAMDHGLARLKGGFPLSLRLLREIHGFLLARGRGEGLDPGEFCRSQNWIGGTRPGNAAFVPPPPHEVTTCMGDLERFLHADTPNIPVLVKAGLAHVQFETIHPFLDGNGRLGRLLITLFLFEQGVLRDPLLYLSLYLKANRSAYYEHLQAVRETGDWERWLDFFLTGVVETSTQAAEAARRILALFDADRRLIEALGRPASSALRVHQLLQTKPLITIPQAAQTLALSRPTIASSLAHLQQAGIVRETTGRQRGRAFVYDRYLALLNEGTEPLRRP
jgi:Fic family protein